MKIFQFKIRNVIRTAFTQEHGAMQISGTIEGISIDSVASQLSKGFSFIGELEILICATERFQYHFIVSSSARMSFISKNRTAPPIRRWLNDGDPSRAIMYYSVLRWHKELIPKEKPKSKRKKA